ncbi:hypothetical protein [Flavobacterium sp.]|uniref:hypothetical protein n=1 Tax=Flavobacterium sp. TaxID=239 RepID=UPI0025C3CC9F|nr:hypothetical protein [Flavobacterium sp.]
MNTSDQNTSEHEKDDYLNVESLSDLENCHIDSLKPTPKLLDAMQGDWSEDFS